MLIANEGNLGRANGKMKSAFRQLFPVWLGELLLPFLGRAVWWEPDDRNSIAITFFFISCGAIVVSVFRRSAEFAGASGEGLEAGWRKRSLAAGMALVLASSAFSVIWLLQIAHRDYAACTSCVRNGCSDRMHCALFSVANWQGVRRCVIYGIGRFLREVARLRGGGPGLRLERQQAQPALHRHALDAPKSSGVAFSF